MTPTHLAEAIFVALTVKDPNDLARNAQVAMEAAEFWVSITTPATPRATIRATIRTVMWALNKLKAAPGQPNRDLVRKFLYMKNWIGHIETPEDWNLDHVPTTQEAIIQLVSDVREFDIAQHKPVTPEP